MRRIIFAFVIIVFFSSCDSRSEKEQNVVSSDDNGWISLFDGYSLKDWKIGGDTDIFSVKDSMIIIEGSRGYLYYDGPVERAHFVDFEFEAEVKTESGYNSGVYFHTEFRETGQPHGGLEVQINNSSNDYRKTGSLWGIVDITEKLVKDNEWFSLSIKSVDKRIQVKLNDSTVVDMVIPAEISTNYHTSGTFAIQGWSGYGSCSFKNIRVKTQNLGTTTEDALPDIDIPNELKKLASTYKSLNSYRDSTITKIQTVMPGIDMRITVPSDFGLEKPNHIFFHQALPIPFIEATIVMNDSTFTQYLGRSKEYAEQPTPTDFEFSDLHIPTAMYSSSPFVQKLLFCDEPLVTLLEGVENIKIQGRDKIGNTPTTVIELIKLSGSLPSTEMSPGNVNKSIPLTLTLWIGEKDYLIRKIFYEIDFKDYSDYIPYAQREMMNVRKMSYAELHTQIQIDEDIQDDLFTFTPSALDKKVAQFERPGMPRKTDKDFVGQQAPNFVLKDVDGEETTLNDFKGKVVIINFWATWCSPCLVEIPTFISLQSQYAPNAVIIGISTDTDPDKVRPFIKQQNINYPILMSNEDVKKDYGGISAIPSTFVVDKKGIIRYSYVGVPRDQNIFQQNIEELLQK